MTVNRRFVLKGMALSGMTGLALSGAMPSLASVLPAVSAGPDARREVIALTGGAPASLFAEGVFAALGETVPLLNPGQDVTALLGFERTLRESGARRVIGLLDDASATLVLDIARSAGARVLWVGQHNSNDDVTRHRLIASDLAHACTQSFSGQLAACGAAVRHDPLHSGVVSTSGSGSSGRLSTASHRAGEADWVGSLGYLLASLGHHQPPAAAVPIATGTLPPHGSFVSFLIET